MANHKNAAHKAADDAWMFGGTQAWWSAMSEYNGEFFDFMSHRFAKDSRAFRDLGECDSWSAVTDLNRKWLQDAFKDYSAEATKFMAIYVKQSADVAQERRVH
jgi:hypothetical protein